MKKLLLLFILTIIPLASNAQRVDKPGEPYEYYCTVSVNYFKGNSSKIKLEFEGETCVLVDENGEELKLPMKTVNDVDIKLFMSKRGWKFVEKKDNEYLWDFKKEVTSDEQAKEGFRLKTVSSREGFSPFLNQK